MGSQRPLLNISDREDRVRDLLKFRHPLYLQAADYIVDTSGLDPKDVADAIIGSLMEEL